MSETNDKTTEEGGNDPRDVEIEKLRAKNKELLQEKQKEKAKAQALADEKDEADARAAESGGNMEALKAAHAKELKKLHDKLENYDGELRTIRVDNELAKSLSEGNVRPEMSEALTALMKSKVQYDNGVATIDGEPLGAAVGKYLGSELGAHFRRASDNSGGGATGNTSGTKTARMTKENFNFTEFAKIALENPAEANAIADAVGRPNLKTSL